jgi:hypothetical protein
MNKLILSGIILLMIVSAAYAQSPFSWLARSSLRAQIEVLEARVAALETKLEANRQATLFVMKTELDRHITLRDADFTDGKLLDAIDGTTTAWSAILQTEVTDKAARARIVGQGKKGEEVHNGFNRVQGHPAV